MNLSVPLDSLSYRDRRFAGPGAWSLRALGQRGFSIPRTLCVTTRAYDEYAMTTGLKERILMELNRKDPHALLWEEIWGSSLRIRNMFLNIPMPLELRDGLKRSIQEFFGSSEVTLRPSSPPDSLSFPWCALPYGQPGGVAGVYTILEHIRLVWASACTGCASLAFKDMGAAGPTGAVLIQEAPAGSSFGRAYRTSPGAGSRLVMEYGVGQGAEGQWILDEGAGTVLSHAAPCGAVTLSDPELCEASGQAAMALDILGPFGEIEWALHRGKLSILHARTGSAGPCFPGARDLRPLGQLVESSFIPRISAEADALDARRPSHLADSGLAAELVRRREARRKWTGLYRDQVMPFAFAAVIFGALYNDAVRPVDPYEFVDLLMPSELPALRKDLLLEKMAELVRDDKALLGAIRRHTLPHASSGFMELFHDCLGRSGSGSAKAREGRAILELVLGRASMPPGTRGSRHAGMERLTEEFFASLAPEMRRPAREALELARSACRLQNEAAAQVRRIERLEEEAVREERRRRVFRGRGDAGPRTGVSPGECTARGMGGTWVRLSARQLPGMPCSPGMARGQARVVRGEGDLTGFKAGEIMVCGSLEPGMAAIVPLAHAVVAEQGSLLREGTAIARRYGLPYVTGVSDATRFIRTGDRIVVDGHLGIVIIEA